MQTPDVWTETHFVVITTGAAIGNQFLNLNLDQGGNFVGGCICFATGIGDQEFVRSAMLNLTTGGILTHGAYINQIRASLWQLDATARTVEVIVTVMLSKP